MNIGEILGTLRMKDEFTPTFNSIKSALSTFGVGIGVAAVLKGIYDNTAAAAESFAQLEAAVKSTGGAAGLSADQISQMASKLERLTGVEDDTIAKAQSVLLTFTKIGKDAFEPATIAALDLSRRLGGDLQGAIAQVGKALQDPIAGISALRRANVSFSESQQSTIKSFVETNQLAKAQAIILAELTEEVGGSAEAFRNTLPGAISALRNSWGNLLEEVGRSDSGVFRTAIEGMVSGLDYLKDNWFALEGAVFTVLANNIKDISTWVDRGLGLIQKFAEGQQAIQNLVPDFGGFGVGGAAQKLADDSVKSLSELRASVKLTASDFEEGFREKAAEAIEAALLPVKGLDEAQRKLQGNTIELTDEQRKLAQQLAVTTKEILLSTAANREKLRLITSGASDAEIRAIDRKRDIEVAYLQDVDKYGRIAADRLKGLRQTEGDIKALVEVFQPLTKAIKELGEVTVTDLQNLLKDLAKDGIKAMEDAAKKIISVGKEIKGLTADVSNLRGRAGIRREDFSTVREYEEAIRNLNNEQELNLRITEAIANGAIPAQIEAIRKLTLEQQNLRHEIELGDQQGLTATEKWLALADALSNGIQGASDSVNQLVAGFATLIRGIVDATEATTDFQRQQAAVAIAQGAYQVAGATGVLRRNVTGGGFGGRGEGNYTSEGSTAGAVIGGIIGYVYGGGIGGAQAGAAIGSVVGGIVGAFVKKGAQEAIATIELNAGDLAAAISRNEGGLGRVLKQVAQKIDSTVKDILDALGGTLIDIPNVSIKVRDGIISVWVGAANARVKEMDDAVLFAITEILKQADISGLSDTIKTVLENTEALDISELARDLDFGRWFENLGLEDAAIAVEDKLIEFRTRLRRAIELGLDPNVIGGWFGEQLQGIRDAILGIEISPEERLRRQTDAFNQQILLLDAEEKARRADLLARRAELEGKIAILRAQLNLAGAQLGLDRTTLGIEYDIYKAERQILQGMIDALAAVDQALAAVDLILGNLPELIGEDEIQDALRRLRGAGGGGEGRQSAEEFRNELQDIIRSGLPDAVRSIRELGDRLRELENSAGNVSRAERDVSKARAEYERLARIARTGTEKDKDAAEQAGRVYNNARRRAEEARHAEEELARARQVLIDQGKQQVLDSVREFLTPGEGGTFGLSPWEAQADDIRRKFDEAEQANRALIQETGERAIAFWRLNAAEVRALQKLAEDAIDSLGLPMEQVRDRLQTLRETVDFLRDSVDAGVLSASRLDDAIRELSGQAGAELYGLAQSLLDAIGQTEESAKLKAALDEANFDLQVLQLNFLYQQYLALGLISDAVKENLDRALGLINDPANRPDFGIPVAGNTPEDRERAIRELYNQRQAENAQFLADLLQRARDLLSKYIDDGLDPLTSELKQINDDFVIIRGALGKTVEVQNAYNQAIKRAIDNFLAPIRQLQKDLFFGDQTAVDALTRWSVVQDEFTAAQKRFISGDLTVVSETPELIQRLLGIAREVTPIGSTAYTDIFVKANQFLNRVLALTPATLGTASNPYSVAGLDNLLSVNETQLVNLEQINVNNTRIAIAVERIARQQSGLAKVA